MHIDPEQQQSPVGDCLRNLPQELDQPYDWAEFRRRAQARTAVAVRRSATHRTWVAAAAALVLVVLALAAWTRLGRSDLTPPAAHLETNPPVPESRGGPGYSASDDRRTDAAERWLASLPREPGVVRVGTRAVVTGLEDRIAQLDDYLSAARVEGVQPAALAGAEEQRALLVKSLAQVRYAETLVAEVR
jgi:hypothetical protein